MICKILIEKVKSDLLTIWKEDEAGGLVSSALYLHLECDEDLFWKYLNESLSFKIVSLVAILL